MSTESGEGNLSALPNVVLITTHDLGQHLGCYGIDTVDTANIDSFAEQGVRFENAYATSPVCSPARGSLLTGRYPQSTGLMGLTHAPWWWQLDNDEILLPELLQNAGYETHLSGFQHVVSEADRLGIDCVHSTENDAEETAAAAEEIFEETSEDTPLYAQFGFTEVHREFTDEPYDENGVHVPGYLQSTEETHTDLARFQAEINYFDNRVGEILDALEASGHRDDTIVILAADHGVPYPGAKWSCRLPGLEIALVMDGPGAAFEDRETVTSVASNVDVVPTLLDVLGLPIPDHVEGVNFRDHLENGAEPPREMAFAQFTEHMKRDNESRAIVTENWELIRYFDQGRTIDYPVEIHPQRFADHVERMPTAWEPRPFAQLFDVKRDPDGLEDVGMDGEHDELVADLSRQLLQWMVAVDDPLLQGRVRLPYYERAIDDFFTTSTRI